MGNDEKKAKKEKEAEEVSVPINDIDRLTSVSAAREAIYKDTFASQALRRMQDVGLDEKVIVDRVFAYCGGNEQQVKYGLEIAEWLHHQVLAACKKAVELADLMDKLDASGPTYGFTFHFPGNLPTKLREWNEYVTEFAQIHEKGQRKIRSGLDNQKTGEERPEVNISAGRHEYLIELAYLVSQGEKPKTKHFRDIAKLVAVVEGNPSPDYVEKRTHSLRKTFDRNTPTVHKKRRPSNPSSTQRSTTPPDPKAS